MLDPQCIESYKYKQSTCVTSKAEISVSKSSSQPPSPCLKCALAHCAHIEECRYSSCVMPVSTSSTCFFVLSFLYFFIFLQRATCHGCAASPALTPGCLGTAAPHFSCSSMSRGEKGGPLGESRTELSMRSCPELQLYSAA